MRTRSIGSLEVSVVGLGCNNFGARIDAERTKEVVAAALDAGINFFDTADIYGGTKSEEFLGAALGKRRSDVVIATKFGMPVDDARHGAKPDYVHQAIEDSLRRLGTDYVDLYQLHIPDETTPIEDTLGALEDLVSSGKVRQIGCSNFSSDQMRAAHVAADGRSVRFVSLQNEYSLLNREPERAGTLHECENLKMAFIPYYPLARGLLTGKYRRGQIPPAGTRLAALDPSQYEQLATNANLSALEALEIYATRRGRRSVDLAFAWLLAHSVVSSVIAGATSAEQVHANARASDWILQNAELEEIEVALAAAAR